MDSKYSLKNQAISPSMTLAITAKAKKMKADGENIISFGAGEPDFKTPAHIRSAAIDAIESGKTGYTAAAGMPELKQAICDKFRNENNLEYKPENIVVSNGAKHSLYNAFQAILNPGDEVIIPVPYWVSYPELVKLSDGVPVLVETKEEEGFKYNIEILRASITHKTKAILINSPNNPTGTVYTKDELKELAELAVEKNIFVISDEIYEKLIYNGEHVSIAAMGDTIKELTIIVNGMSKGYAMTGWRIGYTASTEKISKIMTNIQSHATSNPNTVAQYASVAGLTGGDESILEMVKAFNERKNFMVDRVNAISSLSCRKPEGAFYVMVNISEIIGKAYKSNRINGSMDVASFILENQKVAVIPGIAFGADNYIRLSYATSMDNIKEGLDRIEKFVLNLK
ncbi:MAG: pyridoxal phosphate-dependent aminotransferase [Clostridia bacterium]|nr:pyridoxal phosphate-dependent aminotransferase [Clostridia bacterium]